MVYLVFWPSFLDGFGRQFLCFVALACRVSSLLPCHRCSEVSGTGFKESIGFELAEEELQGNQGDRRRTLLGARSSLLALLTSLWSLGIAREKDS